MTEKMTWMRQVYQKLSASALSFAETPRITVSGGTRVLVEGHRGLLEYAADRIAAAGPGCRILIRGEGLGLVSMDRRELVVSGRVWAVELE